MFLMPCTTGAIRLAPGTKIAHADPGLASSEKNHPSDLER
jgi:hypothetical protein